MEFDLNDDGTVNIKDRCIDIEYIEHDDSIQCGEGELGLWNVCYNIDNTTSLNLSGHYDKYYNHTGNFEVDVHIILVGDIPSEIQWNSPL